MRDEVDRYGTVGVGVDRYGTMGVRVDNALVYDNGC